MTEIAHTILQTNQPVNIIQFHTVIKEDGSHAIYALDDKGVLWIKPSEIPQMSNWIPLNRSIR